ncbi:hypothetical protein EGM88_00565 [Aureibaculum marinum]|uniref:Uncharacterized protein n=1 Tax=Aureibaculum marinum TaxID=2487930 RepID=A0A3N4NXT5_9FLAO|nr:hypothetical protein [Aureibaculum marinum]RPE00875.1 hypothetical protein EGM88_00565 [Aureibaculum marinum]
MKKKVLHSIFSTIIVLIVLLPFTIQALHALEKHEHTHCTSKIEKHFHKKEIDCHFYHLKISYYSFNLNNDFSIFKPDFYSYLLKDYCRNYFYLYPSSKSSRAPPYFIV